MARISWNDLSPRARRLIVAGSALDTALKLAALIDLVRRPTVEIRGSKVGWAVAISLTNSVGVVPIAYFRYGRRMVTPTPGRQGEAAAE